MAVSPFNGTLVANVVTTVTFDTNFGEVEVFSVNGLDKVSFTADGSTPTIGGQGCHVLAATINAKRVKDKTSGNTVVKLISASAVEVEVSGVE